MTEKDIHPFSRYRLRLLRDFVRIIIIPSIVLTGILSTTNTKLSLLLSIVAHIAFWFIAGYLRILYGQYRFRQEACSLGGEPIIQVVGKWPGNIDIMLKLKKNYQEGYLYGYQASLFEEYRTNTLNLRILWTDMIITADEEHIKHVLATGFNKFWRGRRAIERQETFLGNGIFNRDDEIWKSHRALARPFFSRDRVSDTNLFERYTEKALGILDRKTSRDEPIEVQDMYARFTLDASTDALFGESLNTLDGEYPIPGHAIMGQKGSATKDAFGSFVQAFEESTWVVIRRTAAGYFWPISQLFKDDAVPLSDAMDKVLMPIVNKAVKNREEKQKAGLTTSVDESNFLEYLAEHVNNPKIIRDQILSFLLAGRDTTATLLTFLTYFMALHPDVCQKMRAEVLEQVGPTASPTFETIKNLRYMHAVINETLRLYPPVPGIGRSTRDFPAVFPKSDPTYPERQNKPVVAPKDAYITLICYLPQRNKVLWGEDAEEFDPDRWLDSRLKRFTDHPSMYLPFSAGPRICLGQNYARNEAMYFLCRLLQQYDSFTLAPEFQPKGSAPPAEWKNAKDRRAIEKIHPLSVMTLFIKGGLWVKFRRADDSEQ
ncbi:cytochrome P450 monooxygenase CYP63 [Abortiporus biennis]|nr:cytochrome P450 monooxygenase CYP63 [Abortiporus biennis]